VDRKEKAARVTGWLNGTGSAKYVVHMGT